MGEKTVKNVNHAIKVYVITDVGPANVPSVDSDGPDLGLHAAPDGTVSILFSDMEGSTAMFERLGDLAAREVLAAHNAIVRDQIAAHQGFEVKSTGDGFMVAFSRARAGPSNVRSRSSARSRSGANSIPPSPSTWGADFTPAR